MQKTQKNNRNTTITIIVVVTLLVLVAGLNILKWAPSGTTVSQDTSTVSHEVTSNVKIENGIQLVTIAVGHGYSPTSTMAKSGLPTKILFQWKNAYGCESSIRIPSVQYSKNIEPNGSDMVDIGNQTINTSINILCSMGMYSANIEFI